MSRAGAMALGGLAVLLLGVLGWQIASGDEPPAPRGADPQAPGPAPVAGAPAAQPAAWAAAMLARPLFSPDRRPPPAEDSVAEARALPRLTGILSSPRGRSAIFAGGPDGRPLVLQEGARIAGFAIGAIGPRDVTLVDAGGSRILRTSFDPAPPRGREAAGAASSPARTGSVVPPPGLPVGMPPGVPSDIPFQRNATPSGLDIILNMNRAAATPAARP